MKNILVATDFSNNAYCALFYATKLLESKTCTFHIINTYNALTPLQKEKTPLLGSMGLLKKLQIQSHEKLTKTLHKIVLDTENPKHSFKTISQKGDLVRLLNSAIISEKIDLLVMGNKGATGAKELFLGSNTIQAVNGIKQCPVLTIPKEMDYKAPKEIAFVTDYKKGCSKKTLAPLVFLASLTKAAIRVMHINEEEIPNKEQESNRKLIKTLLQNTEHSFQWVRDYTDKALAIDTFLEKSDIDMFAMVRHNRSFLERLLREPVIKDLSIYSDIPFLILPQQD